MTTQYRFESQISGLESTHIISQTRDVSKQSARRTIHLRPLQNPKKNTVLPESLFSEDNSQLRFQFGYYVLIDQVIAKGETAPTIAGGKAMARLAHQLLSSCNNLKVLITSANAPGLANYHQQMLEKAREVIDNTIECSQKLLQSAASYLEKADELINVFAEAADESFLHRQHLLKNYLSSWQRFIRQYLIHRIEMLKEKS